MAIKNVEMLYTKLLQTPEDVVVSESEAAEIYKIFRSGGTAGVNFNKFKYKAFLQAALMSVIDASEAMSWVEALFRGAYRPNASVKGIS